MDEINERFWRRDKRAIEILKRLRVERRSAAQESPTCLQETSIAHHVDDRRYVLQVARSTPRDTRQKTLRKS